MVWECVVLWFETGVFIVGFTDLYVGFWGFGIRFEGFGAWFGGFLYLFSGFAVVNAAVFVGDAAVSMSDFFMFHCLFAGIYLRFSVLPCVKRRECGGFHRFMCDLWRLHGSKHCYYGEKCRNGCGFGCLRGWFRRLRMGFGGFGVVFRRFWGCLSGICGWELGFGDWEWGFLSGVCSFSGGGNGKDVLRRPKNKYENNK